MIKSIRGNAVHTAEDDMYPTYMHIQVAIVFVISLSYIQAVLVLFALMINIPCM